MDQTKNRVGKLINPAQPCDGFREIINLRNQINNGARESPFSDQTTGGNRTVLVIPAIP